MAFRTEPSRPQARIVVEADSHEQLNHILLALDRAVNSYGQQLRTRPAGAKPRENAFQTEEAFATQSHR